MAAALTLPSPQSFWWLSVSTLPPFKKKNAAPLFPAHSLAASQIWMEAKLIPTVEHGRKLPSRTFGNISKSIKLFDCLLTHTAVVFLFRPGVLD